MAHARQQIREAVLAAVTGLATTGANVFVNKITPQEAESLPNLLVYTNGEQSEADAMGGEPVAVTVDMTGIAALFRAGHRIRVKCRTTANDLEYPTTTDLWPTANWMEREAWDFFGIKFQGHPNLTRILNMEDFPAFPLRKDYPMEDPTRKDKDDRFFGR